MQDKLPTSALLAPLQTLPIDAVMGGIALPNAASVGLHEKFGFEKDAHFKEAGFKQERWIDIGCWQLILQPFIMAGDTLPTCAVRSMAMIPDAAWPDIFGILPKASGAGPSCILAMFRVAALPDVTHAALRMRA
jgi:hypothetical protein